MRWVAQPRQERFLQELFDPDGADEIFYGGSAGGGKTESLLMGATLWALKFPGSNILFLRKTNKQLQDKPIPRSKELITLGMSKPFNETRKQWCFHNGSMINFGVIDKRGDETKYQSAEYDLIIFDELTHWPENQYIYMLSRNRTSKPGIIPKIVSGSNPGNIGHVFVKSRFIDPAPQGETIFEVITEEMIRLEVKPRKLMFIPSKLTDNQILMKNDPGYMGRLLSMPENERKALLHGDWNVFEGQYFSMWDRDVHVIQPFEIPPWWRRFRSLDYGLDMTACYDWAVDNQGFCYITKELYKPNLTLPEAAKVIKDWSDPKAEYSYTVASPDLWRRTKHLAGVTGFEILNRNGLKGLRMADDKRITGWQLLQEMFTVINDEQGEPAAKIRFFNTCINAIKTIPKLVRDDGNSDDVSDSCEDHAAECLVGETLVKTLTGYKPIIKIESGEYVLTRKGFKRVLESWCTGDNEIFEVKFSNGTSVKATANHPFFVNGKWQDLKSIRCGDIAEVEPNEVDVVRVVDILPIGISPVYNLEVEDEPEFYANGILVHNSIRYGAMSRPASSLPPEKRQMLQRSRRQAIAPRISRITGY